MNKNIAIVVLAFACLFLLVNRQMERRSMESREISVAEYGGIIALRDILPAEVFQEKVMPFLQQALADGKMTRRHLKELDAQLQEMGRQTLEAAQKVRPQDALARAWSDTRQGASSFGSQLGRNMRDAMDELSRMMDEMTRSEPIAPTLPNGLIDPSAPAQI